MNIIFDLDGTLIDSSQRMYRLFCDLLPSCHLTKEEYWNYKRNKVNHEKMLNMLFPDINVGDFQTAWMAQIEKQSYLEMDKLFNDTLLSLDRLHAAGEIYLLTARHSRENLMWELKKLGLMHYFTRILVTEGKYGKNFLLERERSYNTVLADMKTLFVSDMGKDILIGNKMKYYTVAISHGFMSEDKLREYKPNILISNLSELIMQTPVKKLRN